jgi:1-acyl-sn-glycerol-3-phosphate acyltransferase
MAKRKVRGAQKSIYRRNLIFYMIQPYVRLIFYQFYGKVEFKGRENIPLGEPVIFAPNHQNALMDALMVLFASPQDMVFLARADIFSGRFMAYFFNSLKILPVFRQRDGASELGKNEDIFDISVDILKHRHFMCIMPEGNHGHRRRLRPFGKGIFRIGFTAQEDHGTKPFVKIVPAGIDMGDYIKHNTSLLVTFGKPIELSDYWEQYQEAAPRAMNAAKKDLIAAMKPGMINISSDEYYDTIMSLRKIYNDIMRAEMGIEGTLLSDRLTADQEMIARIEAVIEEEASAEKAVEVSPMKELHAMVEKYTGGVKEMKIREWVVREKGYGALKSLGSFFVLLLSFPFFLYGFLFNIIPYWIPVRAVRNIKDFQFHTSVKAGLGMFFTFPPTYIITTVLIGIFTGPWWIWVAHLVLVYPLGRFALKWYGWWKKTTRGSWFNRRLRRGDSAVVELVSLREEIIDATKKLIGR